MFAAYDNAASQSVKRMRVALVGKDKHLKSLFDAYAQFLTEMESSWEVRTFLSYEHAIR